MGRALLSAPAALLMDEPLASLDAPRKAEILPYLERLRDQARLPIIYVSHAIDEVAQLARTMVLMSDGRVVATGPIAEIMNRLDLRPITGRFEAGVVVEGIVHGHDQTFQLITVSIGRPSLVVPRLAEGARVRLRIRARDVALAAERPAGISIQNILAGRVTELSREEGTFVEVNVDVDSTILTARLTKRAVAVLRLAPGQPVFALIKSIALDRVVRFDTGRT
jgi:molybdate transport system ATP-binding protein